MPHPSDHNGLLYRTKAVPLDLVRSTVLRQKERIFEKFEHYFEPQPDWRVLDLGVNASNERRRGYFFECNYPFPEMIEAAGLEDGQLFGRLFPQTPYHQVVRHEPLPFDDDSFDLVFCNAVIEHVGDRRAQEAFLHDLLRVGKRAFVTTPNRWHPLEFHTVTPLLHWAPPAVYRPIWKRMGMDFFADEENLNLLDEKTLRSLMPKDVKYDLFHHHFLGFRSNLLVCVTP